MTTTPSEPSAPLPYGTPDAPRITVRGEAHLEADPELARIRVTVQARSTDRRTALDDLTHRNTTALDLIKSYGQAVDKIETSTLSLAPELTKHGRGVRVRSYQGRTTLTAELTDFTALGELTTRLADLDLTRVDGPEWLLRRTSPVHAQARNQAVHEAVRRAREYADALSTTVAALLELSDTGKDTYTWMHHEQTRGFTGPDDEPAPALDLEPQRQHVQATVDAVFTLHPPTL